MNRRRDQGQTRLCGLLVLVALVGACTHQDAAVDGAGAGAGDDAAPAAVAGGPVGALAAPLAVASPPDNPSSPAKIELGRLLFWDPILSGERDVACATCHHPDFAYADGRRVSVGAEGIGLGPTRTPSKVSPHQTTRNSMTILDAAWNGRTLAVAAPDPVTAPMFWDSRVRSLEEQAKGPISALDEMRGPSFDAVAIFPEIVARLTAIPDYASRFEAAFDGGVIDEENIVRAIATFERTLIDHDSSFDRYQRGDAAALTTQQKRGLDTFNRSGCSGCHSGPMFSDYATHRLVDEGGRGAVARTPDVGAGNGAFRTASLRNVTRTAPYMNDGVFTSLDAVFELYRRVDKGADPKLRALRVPDGSDRADVIALLQSLSDGDYDKAVPAEVPSGLPVGGNLR